MATAGIRPGSHLVQGRSSRSSSSRSSQDANEIVEEKVIGKNGEVRIHRYLKGKFLGKVRSDLDSAFARLVLTCFCAGRVCKVLRAHLARDEPQLLRQNRLEGQPHEAEGEG